VSYWESLEHLLGYVNAKKLRKLKVMVDAGRLRAELRDALDGVRVYFHNGDVAHVRPSGNAPQLRIYANSSSQARADQIVELGLREPDGILRQLERAFT